MTKKGTILHVIDEMGIGGAEILLISTIRLLPQYHHVLVSLFKPRQPLDARINLDGIEVHCLDISNKYRWPAAICTMRRIIKSAAPLLVHAHLQRAGFVSKIATPKRVPLFYSLHTPYTLEIFRNSKISVPAERLTARPYHHLIGVSQYVIDDYQAVISASGTADKLYNFVDAAFFAAAEHRSAYTPGTPLRCISVGNLKKSKNYPYTFRAFKSLAHLPITLDVYGTGPEQQYLTEMLRSEQITNVTLKGSIRNVAEVLPRYDAYIMSSTYEGFGLGPLEAMASGMPALLSRIPVFDEIIGDNAIRFGLDDAQVLAGRLRDIYDGRMDWPLYAARALVTAKRIATPDAYRQQLLDIYSRYTTLS